jgi:hypothetical protein
MIAEIKRPARAAASSSRSLGAFLVLEAAAGVRRPSVLPMLCFPAVLFSGAILPVHVMAAAGAAINTVIPVRWAFEGIGHTLAARGIQLHGDSPLGPPLIQSYGNAGTASTGAYLLYLGIFTAVFFLGRGQY